MADLFLSYAREDRECAETLARALAQRGRSVWWDRHIHVGKSFSAVIEQELTKARYVVVLWSKHSVASDWVQNEAADALHRGCLIPVRIEDVKPPLEFRRLQTADLLGWRRGPDSPDVRACVDAIEFRMGYTHPRPQPIPTPPQPPRPQPPPPQPGPQPQPRPPAGAQIPNYLVPAILVTVLCCLPPGVVAIIYATQVNAKLAAGDFTGAKQASDNAKMWMWIGAGLGILMAGFWFLMVVASSMSGY